jgi:hypothetical protein
VRKEEEKEMREGGMNERLKVISFVCRRPFVRPLFHEGPCWLKFKKEKKKCDCRLISSLV